MRAFRDIPIKHKLMAIIMLVTGSALLLAALGMVFSDWVLFRRNMQRDVLALTQIVGDNSTAALQFEDPRAATDTLSTLRARPHVVMACMYQTEGRLFAQYRRAGARGECPPGKAPDELSFTDTGLLSRQPILLHGQRVGTLVMLTDTEGVLERILIYGELAGLLVVLASLLAFFLSSKLQTVIAGPISHLAETARSVSDSRDYSIRAQKFSADELGRLAEDFNEMLVRIQSQDSDLRQALLAQKAALEETQEIRDSLRTTLASIADAVISTDADGRVVFINEVARSLLRLPETGGVGRHLDEVFRIIDEFSRERVESPMIQVLRDGRLIGMSNHTILIASDGTEIPIDDSGAPVRSENGAIQGTVLVFRDVTPRRRAEETSRLLAAIVESTEDAIFSNDLQGMVTSWNKGAERMFGFSAQEMIGRPVADLAPADGLDELDGVLERIRRGERIERHETLRRTKSGGLLRVSEVVSPMRDPLGRVGGASTISRDITEQARAADRLARLNEDLRQSNQTLALTNQDLERFAFIASHDLQEPLRMITAYSQLLIKSHRGEFDEEAGEFVGTIVEGTRRMRELLADLLAYTEIRTRDEEKPELVDLNVVLDKVRQNLKAAIVASGASVTNDLLPTLRAQGGHFQPLFQNLIENAIKYRSDAPPRIHVSVRTVGGELQYAVSDNGLGIDPQYHAQIFEVFRRLHGKKIPGTGVGLAICQRVVERYGGRIWVESEAGKGATFLFTLPNLAVETAGENPK
jgi:PAS domain S-box-containing protein